MSSCESSVATTSIVDDDNSVPVIANEPSSVSHSKDTIVACYLSEYQDEEPQIGKILRCNENHYILEWMTGSYSKPWRVYKEKKGKEYVAWSEEIPKAAVLCSVSLSESNRLPENLVEKLKTLYKAKRKP